jgi:hypothetical protein
MSTKKATNKKPRAKLPEKFRGAAVVRGHGMDADLLDALIEKHALANFDATKETFLVVEDGALEDDFGVVVRCFANKAKALRAARAFANGNVDHRVLRVIGQVLVVATENDL